MIIKVCLIASQAFYGQQVMTAPNGRSVKENVVVLQKCITERNMNSIFHERAWKKVKELRKWSQFG